MKMRPWQQVAVAAALAAGVPLRGQDLVEAVRAGDAAAVSAAADAVDAPSVGDVNGLLALLQAGSAAKATAAQRVAAELAFSLIGWWSLQDVDVASGLYDRFEARDWPRLDQQLLELAALGGADGTERAARLLGSDDRGKRRQGARMLRLVGGDRATLEAAIAGMLDGDDAEFVLGLELVWEFEIASEDLRRRLERRYESSASHAERLQVLRAMVRGGGFTTAWLLAQRAELSGDARKRLDYFVGQAADRVFARWRREQAKMTDDAMLAVVNGWLEAHAATAVAGDVAAKAADPVALLADRAAQPLATARRWSAVQGDAGALLLPRLLVGWLRPDPRIAGADSYAAALAIEMRAADRAGAHRKLALPLLQWLAPRRPASFRAWIRRATGR
ncbi:MAG: hypothetical protein ACE37K_19155 [Planctomycetota bacterium]